ncbi:hypothetical protein JOB18_026590 [Solea senegalensis]|uniref:Niban 1/2/3 domain-containing protein n=1 Tax=Solea senegalensis TaxID=28829 RepID=A0AAV6QPU2_SOLSE|nr:hypothetical protein JOB18_026590 [Solea senegalensis]
MLKNLEHMEKISMLAFHPVKMHSCYEKVLNLSLEGLQQQFDMFEQILHQSLEELCKIIQHCQDRVIKHNSELCHVQKFADDTAIVGCIRSGNEDEYRELIQDFVKWCDNNHLLLNTTKTREMVVDFRRSRVHPEPVLIKGDCVEVVHTYKYLGVQLDDRLDWTSQPYENLPLKMGYGFIFYL